VIMVIEPLDYSSGFLSVTRRSFVYFLICESNYLAINSAIIGSIILFDLNQYFHLAISDDGGATLQYEYGE